LGLRGVAADGLPDQLTRLPRGATGLGTLFQAFRIYELPPVRSLLLVTLGRVIAIVRSFRDLAFRGCCLLDQQYR
jgi:hypothetical protein